MPKGTSLAEVTSNSEKIKPGLVLLKIPIKLKRQVYTMYKIIQYYNQELSILVRMPNFKKLYVLVMPQ